MEKHLTENRKNISRALTMKSLKDFQTFKAITKFAGEYHKFKEFDLVSDLCFFIWFIYLGTGYDNLVIIR